MSQLRSILDQLGLVDPEALTVDELDVETSSLVGGWWARQDLNLQPTDYEPDTAPSDDQEEAPRNVS
jgi:hypothetical protein